MKNILCFIFICIFCLAKGFSFQEKTRNIILQPAGASVSEELLTKSCEVISSRLETYDPAVPVSVVAEKKVIKVRVPESINAHITGILLTAKGNFGFYETLTVNEIADLTKNEFRTIASEARICCYPFENKHIADSVEAVLKPVKLFSNYKVMWGSENNKSTCLYVVKRNPALTKSDIDSVYSSPGKEPQSVTIGIRFKQGSAKTWAALTGRNLEKPIAIVLDDKVYYTPVVKTPMENGVCEITGDFTQRDVNYFLALAGNDTLPVNLSLKQ